MEHAHGHVSASLKSLHEGLGAGLGDGAEVVHQVGLGHADAAVDDVDALVLPVGHKVNVELGVGLEGRLVGEADVADLVQSIGSVRDELAQEDLIVRVERVDDEIEQLVDLSLEGERLNVGRHDAVVKRGEEERNGLRQNTHNNK